MKKSIFALSLLLSLTSVSVADSGENKGGLTANDSCSNVPAEDKETCIDTLYDGPNE